MNPLTRLTAFQAVMVAVLRSNPSFVTATALLDCSLAESLTVEVWASGSPPLDRIRSGRSFPMPVPAARTQLPVDRGHRPSRQPSTGDQLRRPTATDRRRPLALRDSCP